MANPIRLDALGTPESPTLVLATRSGHKINGLRPKNISASINLATADEFSFSIDKEYNGIVDPIFAEVMDFRLVWWREGDRWFELTVDVGDDKSVSKTVTCTSLAESELANIKLYGIEINTEDDIARPEYTEPTLFYRATNAKASLLNRITENAPNYRIGHVDSTLANIQRTFSFDNESIGDALKKIGDEIGCLFRFEIKTLSDGTLDRIINAYDLQRTCKKCGYRGEFDGTCPKCGSSEISEGYGEDTGIFVASDKLGDSLKSSAKTDQIMNCFRLSAGDDLMTATIRSCNPNRTDRIWLLPEYMRRDMTDELRAKLTDYDDKYAYYTNQHQTTLDANLVKKYNDLVKKYSIYTDEYSTIPTPIVGYSGLIQAYYDALDFQLYLQDSLMPNATISKTNAKAEAAKLTAANFGTVAVADLTKVSSASADSAVLGVAKIIVDSRMQVKIKNSTFADNRDKTGKIWTGNFTLTNYSDSDDTADSAMVTITITDNYQDFLKQKIDKALHRENADDLSITGLFKMEQSDFVAEIKKYSMARLKSFYDAAQAALGIMIEQGVAEGHTWSPKINGVYDKLYVPYYNKSVALEAEMKVRQDELNILVGTDTQDGIQQIVEKARDDIQNKLYLPTFLGDKLWKELNLYRREDEYSNTNYISDGLSTADLIKNANEFLQRANEELYKSANKQHTVSGSLKNLLLFPGFERLIDKFDVGNWIRVRVDDTIYKLRMIHYDVDWDNLESLNVTFSDVTVIRDGISDVQSIIKSAGAISHSYSAVQRQATKGQDAKAQQDKWFSEGLSVSTGIVNDADNQDQLWNKHGLLLREYDPITDDYLPEQMKIINGTIAVTDDRWKSIRTAVGRFFYQDPETGEAKQAYGVNAETIIGSLFLGERLKIVNKNNSFTIDENGVDIKNAKFHIGNDDNNSYIDWDGKTLKLKGSGVDLDLSKNAAITGINNTLSNNYLTASQVEGKITSNNQSLASIYYTQNDAKELKSSIEQSVDAVKVSLKNYSTTEQMNGAISTSAQNIASDVAKTYATTTDMNAAITASAESINASVSKTYATTEAVSSAINASAESITSTVSKTYATTEAMNGAISTSAQNIASDIAKKYATTESVSTAVQQGVDSLSASVVKNNEVVAKINASTEGVSIASSKISLDGNTVINAINNGSVSINASRINLNGAVSSNGYFKIGTDGKVSITDGSISLTAKDPYLSDPGHAYSATLNSKLDSKGMTLTASDSSGTYYYTFGLVRGLISGYLTNDVPGIHLGYTHFGTNNVNQGVYMNSTGIWKNGSEITSMGHRYTNGWSSSLGFSMYNTSHALVFINSSYLILLWNNGDTVGIKFIYGSSNVARIQTSGTVSSRWVSINMTSGSAATISAIVFDS